jgi:hypothetical protein
MNEHQNHRAIAEKRFIAAGIVKYEFFDEVWAAEGWVRKHLFF